MSETFRLDGRVVVLTGGAGLLGEPYAKALSVAGAHVVVADIDGDRAERVAGSVSGSEALGLRVDVSDPVSVAQMVDLTMETFGRVDGLVNNAALDPKFDPEHEGEHNDSFEDYPLAAWNQSLAVNVTGPFLCAQALAPKMLENHGGSIVNVGSIYGITGPDQRIYGVDEQGRPRYKPVAYSVTKSAMLGLTRYLATYYAGKPIRANTLVLGGVDNHHDPEFFQNYSARTPLGRMAEKDEYSGALIFLLSDASSYMTGAALSVDGGWTAW
jgi:2-deoxy-D-gluconate 3-dehydrogenase